MGRTHDALQAALDERARKRETEEPNLRVPDAEPPPRTLMDRLLRRRRKGSIQKAVERSAEDGA